MNVTPAGLARGVNLNLPVTIRALTVRASSGVGVAAIELRPSGLGAALSLGHTAEVIQRLFKRDNPIARHAAAYGNTSVFFLDDRTAPEEDGFWIWGSREGRLVFTSTSATPVVKFRNGAIPNEVSLRVATDPEQRLMLQSGEERQVSLPPLYGDAAYLVTIRTSSGFRPADVDPRSRDRRFLGVYVVMPDHAVR